MAAFTSASLASVRPSLPIRPRISLPSSPYAIFPSSPLAPNTQASSDFSTVGLGGSFTETFVSPGVGFCGSFDSPGFFSAGRGFRSILTRP